MFEDGGWGCLVYRRDLISKAEESNTALPASIRRFFFNSDCECFGTIAGDLAQKSLLNNRISADCRLGFLFEWNTIRDNRTTVKYSYEV